VIVRPFREGDREWVRETLRELWGETVVSRGAVHDPTALPGFVAEEGGERVGLLTYRVDGADCEVVTIDAFPEGAGAGTALLDAAARAARDAGCGRVWLITTNDNLRALRFYQRRGFRLVAVHPDALERSRELKPSIPDIGLDGIPLRDELELELRL
jgi:ribosomal protein S18 acetylase RimI-like enzyme